MSDVERETSLQAVRYILRYALKESGALGLAEVQRLVNEACEAMDKAIAAERATPRDDARP